MRRLPAIAAALALALAACGGGLTTREDAARQQAEDEAERSYGGEGGVELSTPKPAPTKKAASTTATLVVAIKNAAGTTTGGIPMRYKGPKSGTVATSAKGVAKATLPAGTYEISVPAGCSETVQVFKGSGGTAGLPVGETVRIDLTVDWRHRIAPWPTVDVKESNPFPREKIVEIRYLVQDRCENGDAVNGEFPRWKITPGDGIALAKAPVMKAAGDGWASVFVKCTAAGNPELMIADRDNPEDAFDILGVRAPPSPDRPWCG